MVEAALGDLKLCGRRGGVVGRGHQAPLCVESRIAEPHRKAVQLPAVPGRIAAQFDPGGRQGKVLLGQPELQGVEVDPPVSLRPLEGRFRVETVEGRPGVVEQPPVFHDRRRRARPGGRDPSVPNLHVRQGEVGAAPARRGGGLAQGALEVPRAVGPPVQGEVRADHSEGVHRELTGEQVAPPGLGGHRVDGGHQAAVRVPQADVRGVEGVEQRALEGPDVQGPGELFVEGRLQLTTDTVAPHLRPGQGEKEDDARQTHVHHSPHHLPGQSGVRAGGSVGHDGEGHWCGKARPTGGRAGWGESPSHAQGRSAFRGAQANCQACSASARETSPVT